LPTVMRGVMVGNIWSTTAISWRGDHHRFDRGRTNARKKTQKNPIRYFQANIAKKRNYLNDSH
jgi:hypothetical protein